MRTIEEAQSYTGTNLVCGKAQLEILKMDGLRPEMKVLEIGCGCLSAGIPIMQAIEVGNYVGIEPNQWLIDAASQVEPWRQIISQSQPTFLAVTDFDASSTGKKFDRIVAHSVLAHCSYNQMITLLENIRKVISSDGRAVISFRAAEGNAYGSSGSRDHYDSFFEDWQYPGVSWFRIETICRASIQCGLVAAIRQDYTRYLTSLVPKDFHDWITLWRA